ncbi:hypothetical protein HD806DRAFT_322531 [Xylariaceae sp. AK1471]|nr:hypothetical protein HD806DRAFT_322531 [Xylariaceae sp. AK1471]
MVSQRQHMSRIRGSPFPVASLQPIQPLLSDPLEYPPLIDVASFLAKLPAFAHTYPGGPSPPRWETDPGRQNRTEQTLQVWSRNLLQFSTESLFTPDRERERARARAMRLPLPPPN